MRDLAEFNASLISVLVYGSQQGVHVALILLLAQTVTNPHPMSNELSQLHFQPSPG